MRSIAFILAAAVTAGACHAIPRESQTLSRSVELDKAESVNVELKMGAGELTVGGDAAKLFDGRFRFNVPSWEPVVDYQGGGTRASLRVEQPSGSSSWGNTENDWDLRLNNDVPLDVKASLGAGKATMNLGSLNLRSLEIHQGVGELTLDLRGKPAHSYDVRVSGGVGSTHIRVPAGVAIVAAAKAGLGSVDFQGLEKHGDAWSNPGHENDPVVIHLDVKGGVGEIRITCDDDRLEK
jgi:hypothetical protein